MRRTLESASWWEPTEKLAVGGRCIATSNGFVGEFEEGVAIRPTVKFGAFAKPSRANQPAFVLGRPPTRALLLDSIDDSFCRCRRDRNSSTIRLQFLEPKDTQNPWCGYNQPPWIAFTLPRDLATSTSLTCQYLGDRQILLINDDFGGVHCRFERADGTLHQRPVPPLRGGKHGGSNSQNRHVHKSSPVLESGWVAFVCCSVSLQLSNLKWTRWSRTLQLQKPTSCPDGFVGFSSETSAFERYRLDSQTGQPVPVLTFGTLVHQPIAWDFRKPGSKTDGLFLVRGTTQLELLRLPDGKSVQFAKLPSDVTPTRGWTATTDSLGRLVLASQRTVWRRRNPSSLAETCTVLILRKDRRDVLEALPEFEEILGRFPPAGNVYKASGTVRRRKKRNSELDLRRLPNVPDATFPFAGRFGRKVQFWTDRLKITPRPRWQTGQPVVVDFSLALSETPVFERFDVRIRLWQEDELCRATPLKTNFTFEWREFASPETFGGVRAVRSSGTSTTWRIGDNWDSWDGNEADGVKFGLQLRLYLQDESLHEKKIGLSLTSGRSKVQPSDG